MLWKHNYRQNWITCAIASLAGLWSLRELACTVRAAVTGWPCNSRVLLVSSVVLCFKKRANMQVMEFFPIQAKNCLCCKMFSNNYLTWKRGTFFHPASIVHGLRSREVRNIETLSSLNSEVLNLHNIFYGLLWRLIKFWIPLSSC